jgi:hypothetical protein
MYLPKINFIFFGRNLHFLWVVFFVFQRCDGEIVKLSKTRSFSVIDSFSKFLKLRFCLKGFSNYYAFKLFFWLKQNFYILLYINWLILCTFKVLLTNTINKMKKPILIVMMGATFITYAQRKLMVLFMLIIPPLL